MATNLQDALKNHGGGRCVACNYWTQSCQVMQWDSYCW